eukprot:TRINITY_DN13674_c0_g1_i2.p1 TRINITY_DN13674_c0_g1~~TRINITY_DN13674_c0_g1_i2.p1  ORF type:complete len:227 (+),score=39.25 TRINITY_DN13674_c0_g1_i2:403-1083(+)
MATKDLLDRVAHIPGCNSVQIDGTSGWRLTIERLFLKLVQPVAYNLRFELQASDFYIESVLGGIYPVDSKLDHEDGEFARAATIFSSATVQPPTSADRQRVRRLEDGEERERAVQDLMARENSVGNVILLKVKPKWKATTDVSGTFLRGNQSCCSWFTGLYCSCCTKLDAYNELGPVSYTHLRAHETPEHLVCRLLLEKKKKNTYQSINHNFTFNIYYITLSHISI